MNTKKKMYKKYINFSFSIHNIWYLWQVKIIIKQRFVCGWLLTLTTVALGLTLRTRRTEGTREFSFLRRSLFIFVRTSGQDFLALFEVLIWMIDDLFTLDTAVGVDEILGTSNLIVSLCSNLQNFSGTLRMYKRIMEAITNTRIEWKQLHMYICLN